MNKKVTQSPHPKLLNNKLLLGRSEWCALPDLNIPAIKAKIDTGAKNIFPPCFQHQNIQCQALVIDGRSIMSSNAHREHRYVIQTPIMVGHQQWEIEVTLSNRDPLKYRMLLGRESLFPRALIDPSLFCNQSKLGSKLLKQLYENQ